MIKVCEPANPAFTNIPTYTLTRQDGAVLNSFFSFDSAFMSIIVSFYSEVGTYDMVLRATLPNGQTAHDLFTIIIKEKPEIIVSESIASKFANLLTN